jgi:hypothetical protein
MNITNSSATGILMIDQTRAENAAFALYAALFLIQAKMYDRKERKPAM